MTDEQITTDYHILIVEDDEGLNRLIQRAIEKIGIDASQAYTGENAITYIEKNPKTLMLLDFILPDMEAKEVIETLKTKGLEPEFIIMTGQGDEKISVEMMKLGARDYLLKESNFLELLPQVIGHVLDEIEMEKKLEEAEDTVHTMYSRYVGILSAVPDIILEKDAKDVYTWANRTGFEFFGNDVLGRSAQEYFIKEEGSQKEGRFYDGSDDVIYKEVWHRRADGEKRLLAWRIRPIRDPEGEITGKLCIAHDITNLRKMEEDLYQSKKLASIGQLTAGIAHEINTPLTNISLLAANISKMTDDPKIIKKLEVLSEQRRIASNIVKDLLSFSRKNKPNYEVVNLCEIITDSLSSVEGRRNEDIDVVRVPLESSLCIKADPYQIQQVFMNLMSNAYDAMPEGGTLEISVERTETWAIVKFKDTGEGISEEDLEKIFDPFFTKKEIGRGTGLGLSICHGIIDAHKGKINVESELKKGTEFIVSLPLGEKRNEDTGSR